MTSQIEKSNRSVRLQIGIVDRKLFHYISGKERIKANTIKTYGAY